METQNETTKRMLAGAKAAVATVFEEQCKAMKMLEVEHPQNLRKQPEEEQGGQDGR